MIRSLHVINGLGAGGAERSLAELLPELPVRGVQPRVAVLHDRNEGVEELVRRHGIEVVHLPAIGMWGRVAALRRLQRARSIDVVHSTIAEANMIARFACAWGGPPLLTSLVNTPYAPERIVAGGVAPWKLSVLRQVERCLAPRMTDHVHAITEAVAWHSVEHLGFQRSAITVIPRGRSRERLGISTAERRTRVRSSLGIDDATPLILNVGRREPQKGQVHLLRAVRRLRDRGCGVICIVAGRDGTAAAELRQLVVELELEDAVRFLGHRDDVPDLQVAADVFVFPSMYEGLGGALLEAMALRTPILASDVPAIREVLDGGRCGVLVPPGDVAGLATGVSQLLTADTSGVVERAEQRFRDAYDHDTVVEQMAALLIRVAIGEVAQPS